MKEHGAQNAIRNALAGTCFTFRANVGTGWQGTGKPFQASRPITVAMSPGDVLLRNARPFNTGLPPGFSDLFGFVPVTITPDMVGQRVAVFVAIECKSATGRARERQGNFLQAVNDNGGRAGIARTPDDALRIVRG